MHVLSKAWIWCHQCDVSDRFELPLPRTPIHIWCTVITARRWKRPSRGENITAKVEDLQAKPWRSNSFDIPSATIDLWRASHRMMEDHCFPNGHTLGGCEPLQESAGALVDSIMAMLKQECASYHCFGYLPRSTITGCNSDGSPRPDDGQQLNERPRVVTPSSNKSAPPPRPMCNIGGVDEICREQICEWMFAVSDHYMLSRELVSIAMSYLDRFASVNVTAPRQQYRLAALVSLRLAIKINVSLSEIDIRAFAWQVGSSGISDVTLYNTEMHLLSSLSWHVHPPTPLSFVRSFLRLIPDVPNVWPYLMKRVLFELSRYMTELSVCEYYFAIEQSSHVAYASIINAMECVDVLALTAKSRAIFFRRMSSALGIHHNANEVATVQRELWAVFKQSPGLDAFMASVDPEGMIYSPRWSTQQACHGRSFAAISMLDGQVEVTTQIETLQGSRLSASGSPVPHEETDLFWSNNNFRNLKKTIGCQEVRYTLKCFFCIHQRCYEKSI